MSLNLNKSIADVDTKQALLSGEGRTQVEFSSIGTGTPINNGKIRCGFRGLWHGFRSRAS